MSLTDSQIKDLAKKMSIPLGGVFFKDELPKLEFNKFYMINLEDSVDEDGNENTGTHWTCLQIMKYPKGQIEKIYFDPYGAPPPEDVKKAVEEASGSKGLPYTDKDIQSLMNNACGWYCLAFGHFINSSQYRSGMMLMDASTFLEMFDDLNKSVDFKKNEYILKHFFRSEDPSLRKDVDVIIEEDTPGGVDMMKIPVETKMM
jgi:hypothetical protein